MERMTFKEAAPYVGASEYKLRELVRKKRIPAYRVGTKILFRKEALDQWIVDQETKNCSSDE